jgi:hypothetical protein
VLLAGCGTGNPGVVPAAGTAPDTSAGAPSTERSEATRKLVDEFGSYIGGDAAGCEAVYLHTEPPALSVSFTTLGSVSLGDLVGACLSGFDGESPVLVEVSGPGGARHTNRIAIATPPGRRLDVKNLFVADDGRLAASASRRVDTDPPVTALTTTEWFVGSATPVGDYRLAFLQGEVRVDSAVTIAPIERLDVYLLDRTEHLATYVVRGYAPRELVPIGIYRATRRAPEPPKGVTYELAHELPAVRVDDRGIAVFDVMLGELALPPADDVGGADPYCILAAGMLDSFCTGAGSGLSITGTR